MPAFLQIAARIAYASRFSYSYIRQRPIDAGQGRRKLSFGVYPAAGLFAETEMIGPAG